MKPELLSLLSFTLGIAAYSVKELQMHGKLLWSKGYYGFWDEGSHHLKYKKNWDVDPLGYDRYKAPGNWYYRFFKIKYKERFPGSASFFVFLTDGMHLMQFLFFLFISLSFAPILGLTWSVIFWGVAHIIHFCVYRYLQK